MVTRSEVFEANKTVIILNWAKNYYWEGKDVKTSIENTLNHELDNVSKYGIVGDISINDYKNKLYNYVEKCINDIDYLKKELTELRKTYVKPVCKNIKEFFIENELPFKDVVEYQGFLRRVINNF